MASGLIRSREASLVLLILASDRHDEFTQSAFLKSAEFEGSDAKCVDHRAMLVLGQTVIILMRQIDLSISSIVGITAFLSGTLFRRSSWDFESGRRSDCRVCGTAC